MHSYYIAHDHNANYRNMKGPALIQVIYSLSIPSTIQFLLLLQPHFKFVYLDSPLTFDYVSQST